MASNGPSTNSVLRPSMKVTQANTQNLKSKFEALQKVSSSGDSVRSRRGYPSNNGYGNANSQTPAAKTPSEPTSPRMGAATTVGTQPTKVTSPSSVLKQNTPSFTNPSKSTVVSGPRGIITPVSPPTKSTIKTPSNGSQTGSYLKLAGKTPIQITSEKFAELEVADSAQRTQPKFKPKPDPTRATILLDEQKKAELAAMVAKKEKEDAAKKEELARKEREKEKEKEREKEREKEKEREREALKTPESPRSAPTSPRGDPKSINIMDSFDDKWKINYDELEFDELVSAGSAGEVYLGYYFGTPVAIKKLFSLPEDQKHLVSREFSMLQGVNHPNIVQFLGICDHESGIYLITEYVEHGDLFDLLIFGGQPISWKNKVKIAMQVAQAVYYLHSRKIIHRDLKSQNVLIGENMKVKLCDLGLATVIENNKRMTVCGTNEWMAPEIMLQDNYDDKVDIFSFGIVITELISSQPPKKRDIAKGLRFEVDEFRRTLPPGCPEELAQLVIDCCQFKPTDRPGFKEIVTRLRKLIQELEDDD